MLIIAFSAAAKGEAALLERTGINALSETSLELGGMDVRQLAQILLAGELPLNEDSFEEIVGRFFARLRAELTDALMALAAPVMACALLRALMRSRAESASMALVCRLACAALMMERFTSARRIASAALSASARWIEAAAPVLASAMALMGAGCRAAILTPSAALCAKLISDMLRGFGLPLCSVAAAVAVSANLSERFRLNRLFALIRRAVQWGVGLLAAAFVGLLSLQGILVAGQDGATVRAVSQVIRAALPIIGREVSDSSSALLVSAVAVRNAVGVAGMLAGASVCAAPIARLTLRALSLKLAASVMEPVVDASMARVVNDFGDVTRLLAALCVSAALMSILCLGALLSLGG